MLGREQCIPHCMNPGTVEGKGHNMRNVLNLVIESPRSVGPTKVRTRGLPITLATRVGTSSSLTQFSEWRIALVIPRIFPRRNTTGTRDDLFLGRPR